MCQPKTGAGALFARFRAKRQMQKHKLVQNPILLTVGRGPVPRHFVAKIPVAIWRSQTTEGEACPSPFRCKNIGGCIETRRSRLLPVPRPTVFEKAPPYRSARACPSRSLDFPAARKARACPSPFLAKDAFGCSRRRGAECPLQPRARLNSPPA